MRILVLGGYGLIGLAIVRRLQLLGYEVVGLGRSVETGRKACPGVRWIAADIARHPNAADWRKHLADIDVVINAAGALQDGARDNLELSQNKAMVALIDCAVSIGMKRFIQISAPGAVPEASTAFMRTKAAADAHLRRSALDWTILKPGLVIGAQAYGGTALIRMLAGFPVILPLIYGQARLQTVSLEDVVETTILSVQGELPSHAEFDLVEPHPHTLRHIVESFRKWLGFPDALASIDVPGFVGSVVAKGADLLGHLGWRSPLRSTAVKVISEDVLGDPEPFRQAMGRDLRTLDETLLSLPATLQERWFSKLYLAMPIMVGTLSLFWLASGLIGFFELEAASAVLPPDIVSPAMATGFVVVGAIADIVLGVLVLIRPWAKRACYGMILLTLGYLLAGTVLTPQLWLDPLGVFVKTIPAALLAWVASLVLEDR